MRVFFIKSLKKLFFLNLILFSLLFFSCNFEYSESKDWTFMFYLCGDSDSIEASLLDNIWQMKMGFSGGCNVIIFFDGNKEKDAYASLYNVEYSTLYQRAFGEYFTGSRMYKMQAGQLAHILGDSNFPQLQSPSTTFLNTGDPQILENFISYSQNNFPAEHYALFIGSHGSGSDNDTQSYASIAPNIDTKAIISDFYQDNKVQSNHDMLTLSEFSSIIVKKSIELMVFDSCFMSNFEFYYELVASNKFGVKYFVGCPTEQGIFGYYYKDILRYMNPYWHNNVNAKDLAQFIGLCHKNYSIDENPRLFNEEWQSICITDANKILQVKAALDDFATAIHTEGQFNALHNFCWNNNFSLSSSDSNAACHNILYYFNPQLISTTAHFIDNNIHEGPGAIYPYFDIFDFAHSVSLNSQDFAPSVTQAAQNLCIAVDDAVILGYFGQNFPRANNHSTGISLFFPKDKGCLLYQSTYGQLLCANQTEDSSQINWYQLLQNNYK